jgi:hypothetical protein
MIIGVGVGIPHPQLIVGGVGPSGGELLLGGGGGSVALGGGGGVILLGT